MRSYGSARVMSRRSAFTGLAAGALGQVVLAQGAPIPSGKTSAQTGTPLADRGFVGAWIATVAVPGRPPSARLLTLMADGTLIRSAPVMPAAGNAPVTFPSAGQGVWRQTSPTTIDLTFVELEADAQGHFRGTATTSARLTLSADGDSLTGPATTTAADPSGKALSRVTGIVRAKRIMVQPLASPGTDTPAALHPDLDRWEHRRPPATFAIGGRATAALERSVGAMLVDHLNVAMSEDHRHELLRNAIRPRRSPLVAHEPFAALTVEERLRVRASLAELWDRHRQSEVETVDLCGDWSWGYARQSWVWPEWRTVLDWSAWSVLLLLTGYLAAGG